MTSLEVLITTNTSCHVVFGLRQVRYDQSFGGSSRRSPAAIYAWACSRLTLKARRAAATALTSTSEADSCSTATVCQVTAVGLTCDRWFSGVVTVFVGKVHVAYDVAVDSATSS
ncbi:hypothetical protein NP493_3g02064 [Ridgeia piscesae]|uniref:Uncharacterized protein n=1 Tax=Ridgeia piscesae TaxID=27915 RepID=A0AAD9ULU0_RIDPI|nr:hypothetical protein NP493_3g02064 [Ridgeia piscesae]